MNRDSLLVVRISWLVNCIGRNPSAVLRTGLVESNMAGKRKKQVTVPSFLKEF